MKIFIENGYSWRDTNIHHEYFSIVYNNWILGEPDKPDKCHYSQWFSYTRETSLGNQVTKTIYTLVITVLSSPLFVGIPQNHVKVVTILGGEGDLFLLQSLQLSRRSSWWLGLWRPNVSFCLFLVEVPEPSEPDVEINETCWLLHYKQHVRPPGQIVTQKIMANCHTQTKLKWIQRFPLVGYIPHRLQLWDISLPSSHHRGHLHPYIHPSLKVPWKQLSFISIHI